MGLMSTYEAVIIETLTTGSLVPIHPLGIESGFSSLLGKTVFSYAYKQKQD
jgi:hypothetical protein